MRKIKFVDDGQPSLFDYNFGAASASVSSGALAPAANKAAPCQFINLIKKCHLSQKIII
ncbi:MAG: hypothetical protein MSC50_05085 [Campylobacter sp.]|uniref:hypothetical protein n=1 Tax=Campylobacter sp. TaxID=205 RepID=UPI002AA606DE|nr:hypothetical protein [Campylobacter sp.]MCI6579629.1 hypothetical protein [Campylobacter sp.]MCI7014711.1 hypothetical protein [Campylobacter sp.]